MNYHLAILKRPYLRAIIEGRKVVESRFLKKKVAPCGKISRGDRIFFKQSGGGVCAVAVAGKVLNYEGLIPEKITKIRNKYDSLILGTEEYWQEKSESQAACLVWLEEVREIEPIKIAKKDWRSWVVLRPGKDFDLPGYWPD